MRFGIVLQSPGELTLDPLVAQAQQAEDHGFDLVWIDERHGDASGIPSPFVAVAALAPRVASVRIGATADLGGVHPLYVAEESAVADQVTGGRLVLGLRPAAGAEDRFAEAVDIVLASQAPRPFRHEGQVWAIPANLPDNTFNIEQRVRVTPPPAQLEPTVWLQGAGAAAVAQERALSYLGDGAESTEQLTAVWSSAQEHLKAAARRLRRPAVRDVVAEADGTFDAEALVERLRQERAAWGLDVVIFRLPAALQQPARLQALALLGTRVWPRVQIDRLPPGLEDHWRERWASA